MAILKQDINFNLIFLIGVTIAATVLLTLYFVYSMSNVNVDYNTMEKDLKITKANLTLTTKNLNQCANQQLNMSLELNESKKIEEKSREEYNKIYEDTEIELTKTQTGLKDTKDQLEQWIPWEIAYSLKEKTRNDRTSYTNAMLAIVIPDENNSFEYIAERKNCQYCHCISWKINQLFTILGKNMFNKKIKNTYTCPSGTCGTIHTGNDHSYIQPVKWYDFMNNKEYYINLAIERNNQIGNYEITKEA